MSSISRLLLVLSAAACLSAQAQQGPSDPQIAQIVVTANQVDVDAGKLAVSRTKSRDVKQFAQQMITDHTAVNQQASALVGKLGVTPEANPTSQQLTSDGAAARERIGQLSGAAFDRAYVDNEVAYHQAVLDAIDNTLIPSSQNAELKSLLQQVRPAIAAHLDHAKQVQGKLGAE